MNKIAIIAALAAGGSLFAQSVTYGVGGQHLTSLATYPDINNNPVPAVVGTFSASIAGGVVTVSGSGSYSTFTTGPYSVTAPASPTLTAKLVGPTTSNLSVTLATSSGLWEDGDWSLAGDYSWSGTKSGVVPPTAFTLELWDGTTKIATGAFTVVPEPETYAASAALGLVGFGLWRRRSHKA